MIFRLSLSRRVMQCARKDQALQRMSEPSESAKFSSLNRLSETGHALLHLLAGLGYEAAVDMLIADGADPSVKVRAPAAADCLSPVYNAATTGVLSTVLRDLNGDPDVQYANALRQLQSDCHLSMLRSFIIDQHSLMDSIAVLHRTRGASRRCTGQPRVARRTCAHC